MSILIYIMYIILVTTTSPFYSRTLFFTHTPYPTPYNLGPFRVRHHLQDDNVITVGQKLKPLVLAQFIFQAWHYF